MGPIAANLQAVLQRIERAAAAAGRNADSIRLLAVSKTWPAARVEEAFYAGQQAFGENHEQEAVGKITALSHLPIEWHFIGPIQSNKTRPIAERFAWVHSLDRDKVARRLSEQRPEGLPPLRVCVQVNVSGEATKSGVAPNEARALATLIAGLPRLELRGLMTIPAPSDDAQVLRSQFRRLHELFIQLRGQGFPLDTLSMGMSDDLEAAIMEGATLVRVGTAIFGRRSARTDAGGKVEQARD
jgi:pyridoxal phosphate enzyme (YggS family)